MTNQIAPSRVEWVDISAGMMICWMIFIHCLALSSLSFEWLCLLGFFMPWFFFKSGTFYKPTDCKALAKKDLHKLIYPFLIYSGIGLLVFIITRMIEFHDNPFGLLLNAWRTFWHSECIPGNDPLWFLLSLFVVKSTMNVFTIKKIHPLIIAIVSFGLGFALYSIGWQNTAFWFGDMCTGLCFFAFGYFIKDRQEKWQIVVISIVIYVAALILWLTGTYPFPYYFMAANMMVTGNYLYNLPVTIAGIITMNAFFRLLQPYLKFRVLSYVGRNSMMIYVTHWILLTILMFIARMFFGIEDSWEMFFVLAGGCIVLLPVIVEIDKMIKKKKLQTI